MLMCVQCVMMYTEKVKALQKSQLIVKKEFSYKKNKKMFSKQIKNVTIRVKVAMIHHFVEAFL